jgi:DNA-binding NtrC family response regulator
MAVAASARSGVYDAAVVHRALRSEPAAGERARPAAPSVAVRRATPAALPASRPLVSTLLVHALGDSFAALWPALAAECGLAFEAADGPGAFDARTDVVAVVVGAGEEESLASVVREAAAGAAEVAAVGALPSHRIAAAVVRAGAGDYFALPDDTGLLRAWVKERAERLGGQGKRAEFAATEAAKFRFDGILGSSPALGAALAKASRVIPHATVTVLVTGETGTGKELLARALHYNGPRASGPFVDVNCAAIPDQLLESELFGHEKGAFTGATVSKPGLFEVAAGGTLFLDEIAHLGALLQGKILRVLQEREVRRVGGTRSVKVDVRVVAATHVDLLQAVKAGQFREDLYYRLNVVPLSLPPLRERAEDIVPLAKHFASKFAEEYGVAVPRFSAAAERALQARPWPGNVRELRNAVERAVLLGGPSFGPEDFVADGAAMPDEALPNADGTLAALVRDAARRAVERVNGNKSEAARQLGISRSRLLRLLDAGASDDAFED